MANILAFLEYSCMLGWRPRDPQNYALGSQKSAKEADMLTREEPGSWRVLVIRSSSTP